MAQNKQNQATLESMSLAHQSKKKRLSEKGEEKQACISFMTKT